MEPLNQPKFLKSLFEFNLKEGSVEVCAGFETERFHESL